MGIPLSIYQFTFTFLISRVASTNERKRLMLRNIRLDHLSVSRSAKCIFGKTADWIRMPFGVVSGVSRGMGVSLLDGVVIIKGEGQILGVNLGRPIVTNAFATRLFLNYFENLLLMVKCHLHGTDSRIICLVRPVCF